MVIGGHILFKSNCWSDLFYSSILNTSQASFQTQRPMEHAQECHRRLLWPCFCSSKQCRGLKEHSGSWESKPGMGVCLLHTILMLWITLNPSWHISKWTGQRNAKCPCPMPYPLQGPNCMLLPKLRLRLKLDLLITHLPNQEAKKFAKRQNEG